MDIINGGGIKSLIAENEEQQELKELDITAEIEEGAQDAEIATEKEEKGCSYVKKN
jgi:hypothetical protein